MGKRDFSRGTGAQFEAALEAQIARLGGGSVESATQAVTAGVSFDGLKDVERMILDAVGSRAGLNPALTVNLGDGDFAWIYEDNDGDVILVGADGGERACGDMEVAQAVAATWREEVNSACNSCNVGTNPDMMEDVYSAEEIETMVLDKLGAEGYDISDEGTINYAKAAAEYIESSPEEYTIDQWYDDTLQNYPDDLNGLVKACDAII